MPGMTWCCMMQCDTVWRGLVHGMMLWWPMAWWGVDGVQRLSGELENLGVTVEGDAWGPQSVK